MKLKSNTKASSTNRFILGVERCPRVRSFSSHRSLCRHHFAFLDMTTILANQSHVPASSTDLLDEANLEEVVHLFTNNFSPINNAWAFLNVFKGGTNIELMAGCLWVNPSMFAKDQAKNILIFWRQPMSYYFYIASRLFSIFKILSGLKLCLRSLVLPLLSI